MSVRTIRRVALLCLAPVFGAAEAIASPPFVLDDGDVDDVGHLEIDVGSLATFGREATSGTLPYLEADLGVLSGVEADVVAPIAFAASPGHRVTAGPGDAELEAKVRVVNQSASAALPSIALDPTLLLPTGNAARDLGEGRPQLFLPVWLSKDLGRWTVFGGGGPTVGHGAGERDFLLFGAGVLRDVADNWHVGAEVYETTRSGRRDPSLLSTDLDVVIDLSAHVHLFASVGRGAGAGTAADQASVFAGVQVTD